VQEPVILEMTGSAMLVLFGVASGGNASRALPNARILHDGRRILVYFTGLTWTCIKLSCALMLWMRIWVPVFGFFTLPIGFAVS
jgi:hypothetical protein